MQIQQAACQPTRVPRTATRRSSSFGIIDAVGSFLSERSYEGSACTARSYRFQLNPFLAYCREQGIGTLDAITPDLIRDYLRHEAIDERPRGGKNPKPRRIGRTTLRQRHTILSVFLTWCVAEGKLTHSPMATVAKPRSETRLRYAFTRDECRTLLATAREAPGRLAQRDSAIITLLLDTGARASELANLKWSDVHWGGEHKGLGHIEVYGKGAKMRRLTISAESRRVLRRWSEVAPRIGGNWVWVTVRKTHLTADAMLDMLRRLGVYAGLENVHTHRFRHTFAAEFTRQNRDVFATKARLGHARVATTEEYLHSLGADYGSDATYRTPAEWLK